MLGEASFISYIKLEQTWEVTTPKESYRGKVPAAHGVSGTGLIPR